MCKFCCAEAYFANPIYGDFYEHRHFDIFYSRGNDNFFYQMDGDDYNEKIFVEYCPVCGEPLTRPGEREEEEEEVNPYYSKGVSAARKFLENKDYTIKETDCPSCPSFPILAIDNIDGSLHFIAVTVLNDMEKGFDETEISRAKAEKEAMMYLATHSKDDELITKVVFDKIDLVVISGERAMLRLHTNIFGSDENETSNV